MADGTVILCDFYVYVIFRLDGRPCYIGKGRKNRIFDHEAPSKRANTALKSVVNRAALKGLRLPKVKIAEGLSEKDAFAIEVAFIAAIGRKQTGTGHLYNLTGGGEGESGRVISLEHRAAVSRAKKGKAMSPETKAKISAALKGKKKSPEAIEKVRCAQTGKKRGPLSKEALDARKFGTNPGHTGHKHDSESRAKMSAKLRGKPWSAKRRLAQHKKPP